MNINRENNFVPGTKIIVQDTIFTFVFSGLELRLLVVQITIPIFYRYYCTFYVSYHIKRQNEQK